MLARLETSRLTSGLLTIGVAALLPGLMGLKFNLPWGIALLLLAVATIVGSILIARADPEGRPLGDVLSHGSDSVGAAVGGGLFVGFIVGAIAFSAAEKIGHFIALGAYLVSAAAIVLYARAGGPKTAARPAASRAASSPLAGGGSELLNALRNANVIAVGDTGAQVMKGGDLAEMLMAHTAPCLRCSRPIQFQQGGLLAMDQGLDIRDKVIMCGNCHAIFEVHINPSGMRLTADVTSRYGREATAPPARVTAMQTENVRLAAPSLKEELANFQALAARQDELLGRLTPIEAKRAKSFFARLVGVLDPNRYHDATTAFGGLRQYAMTAEGAPLRVTYLKLEESSAGDEFLFVHLADIPPLEFLVCALYGGGYLGYYKTGKELKERLGL
jgi:hypothetical protein